MVHVYVFWIRNIKCFVEDMLKFHALKMVAWSHFDTPKIEIGFYNLQGPNESRFFINFFGCMKTDTFRESY